MEIDMTTWNRPLKLFGGLLGLAAVLASLPLRGATYEQWQEHRQSMLTDPSVVRYYEFETVPDGRIANLANPQLGTLTLLGNSAFGRPRGDTWKKWTRDKYPQETLGRWPQKRAMRFSPARHAVSRSGFYGTKSGSFTITAWARIYNTMPIQLSTLMNMGSGYKSGWRLDYSKHTKWSQAGSLSLVAGIPTGSTTLRTSLGNHKGDSTELNRQYLWHQVAITWDKTSGVLSFYLDGRLADRKPLPKGLILPKPRKSAFTDPASDLGGLQIGAKPSSKSTPLDAKLDELIIFDRVLDEPEILGHFKAGCPDGTVEERLQQVTESKRLEKAISQIRLAPQASSYGYFVRGVDIPVPVQVPEFDGWNLPLTIQFDALDAAGQPVPGNSAAAVIDKPTVGESMFQARFSACGLYWLRMTVTDAKGNQLKREVVPIGIVASLPDAAVEPGKTTVLGAVDLMTSQPECQTLGAGLSRIVCHWNRIEPRKNELDWQRLDQTIDQTHRRGLKIVLCFTGLPRWLKRSPQSPNLPADMERYRSTLAFLVSRYRDDIDFWEIWDGPNSRRGLKGSLTQQANDYVELIKTAAEIIRRQAPAAKIVGVGAWDADVKWLKAVLDRNVAAHLDLVSLQWQDSVPLLYKSARSDIRTFREYLDGHGGAQLPLWNTNAGHQQPARWTQTPVDETEVLEYYRGRQALAEGEPYVRGQIPMVAERRGAAWLVKDILLQMADGVTSYLFDQGPSLYYPSFNHSDGDPSLKGIACAALAARLIPAGTIRRMKELPPQVLGVEIQSATTVSAVLFATSPQAVQIKLPVQRANTVFTGMDLFGNVLTWKSGPDATLNLTLTQEPIYLNK
jgi:hypothetical protein